MIKLTYVFLILISFSAAGNEVVSLDKLYEERDFYDGKELLVSGRFHLQLESNCLCGEKHYIWLNENSIIEEIRKELDLHHLQDKKVIMKVLFSKEKDGHMLGSPGTFVKIFSIVLNE